MYDLTDHLPNFLVFNDFASLPSNIKMYKRDYSTSNQQALFNELQSINWQVLFIDHNPSAMFNSFKKYFSIIDRHVPIKQLSRKELKVRSKPWITPAIRKSIYM